MDSAYGFDEERIEIDHDTTDGAVEDAMFDVGGDERRMHVRAYNHWVSLLNGRAYPSISDLDPERIADFGPHSVLLDFTGGIEDPGIAFLGRTLREECGLDASIVRIADVPSRSLLSRLTDHYLQIIANRAPIGFEAEFIGSRGRTTLYRGILTPFSSDGDGIDFIYGVINWKEVADAETQATIGAELDAAVRSAPKPVAEAPIWADGPGSGIEEDGAEPDESVTTDTPESLADHLVLARESAAAVQSADSRSRRALYRALDRAHDFALATRDDAEGYAELLEDAGIAVQARAPMTPIVKLVFGATYDKTRLTEFATVLQHAQRQGIAAAGLFDFLEGLDGGIKAVVATERLARKPRPAAPKPASLEGRATIAHVAIDTDGQPGSIVVLIARVAEDGGLDVVGSVANDEALAKRAVRAIR